MVSDRSELFGGKLGSTFAATTDAQTLYTALAATEVTRIQVANITNNNVEYSLFHDDTGTSFGTTTALVFNKQIAGKDFAVLEAASQGSGITVAKGGSIGISASAANHLNFTIYGVVQKVR